MARYLMALFFLAALSVNASAQSWWTPKNVTATPNTSGGWNYSSNGQAVGSSQSNIFGGQNFYSSSGQSTGHSSSNIFGGQNYHSSGGQSTGYSRSNIFGGQDYFNNSGQRTGSTQSSIGGVVKWLFGN